MHCVFRSILALFLLHLTAACAVEAPPPPPPPVEFHAAQPFYLNVAYVNVVEEYKPSGTAPFVEHYFNVTPTQAIKRWVGDRIRAVGNDRYLQVIIKDASVREVQLATDKGIAGLFKDEQGQRYDGRVEVEMRVYGSKSALSEASLTASATQSSTIREGATPDERSRLFSSINRQMMEKLNAELEKNIYSYLSNYIDYNVGANPPKLPGQ